MANHLKNVTTLLQANHAVLERLHAAPGAGEIAEAVTQIQRALVAYRDAVAGFRARGGGGLPGVVLPGLFLIVDSEDDADTGSRLCETCPYA